MGTRPNPIHQSAPHTSERADAPPGGLKTCPPPFRFRHASVASTVMHGASSAPAPQCLILPRRDLKIGVWGQRPLQRLNSASFEVNMLRLRLRLE
jgi:hypothetical protein